MVEVFPAEARKSRRLRRVYTRGGVSLGMHEWSVQDFYIEGRGRRSFDATSLHGDSRERGREVRVKVRNLGMEYLACEVGSIEVSSSYVELGYGLETVC